MNSINSNDNDNSKDNNDHYAFTEKGEKHENYLDIGKRQEETETVTDIDSIDSPLKKEKIELFSPFKRDDNNGYPHSTMNHHSKETIFKKINI